MKKKIVSCLLVAVMCTLIGSVAYADESGSVYRADNIKSHGTLQYEQAGADNNVLIASQDLSYLANEIDELESTYKTRTVEALNSIQTYIDSDGNANHTGNQTGDLCSYGDILEALKQSQTAKSGDTLAIADNISSGKAVWCNGKYIIGNGADNTAFYNSGYGAGRTQGRNDVIANPSAYGISGNATGYTCVEDGNYNPSNTRTVYSGAEKKFVVIIEVKRQYASDADATTVYVNGSCVVRYDGSDEGLWCDTSVFDSVIRGDSGFIEGAWKSKNCETVIVGTIKASTLTVNAGGNGIGHGHTGDFGDVAGQSMAKCTVITL